MTNYFVIASGITILILFIVLLSIFLSKPKQSQIEGNVRQREWTPIIDKRFKGGMAWITTWKIEQKTESGTKEWRWNLKSITDPSMEEELIYATGSVTVYDGFQAGSSEARPILLYIGDGGDLNAYGEKVIGADARVVEAATAANAGEEAARANVDFAIDKELDRLRAILTAREARREDKPA